MNVDLLVAAALVVAVVVGALGRDWRFVLGGVALAWLGSAAIEAQLADWRVAALRLALGAGGIALLASRWQRERRWPETEPWPLRIAALALAAALAYGLAEARPLGALGAAVGSSPLAFGAWTLLGGGLGGTLLATTWPSLAAGVFLLLAGVGAVLATAGLGGIGGALMTGGLALMIGALPWLRPRDQGTRLRA